jgi:hypothetical protein
VLQLSKASFVQRLRRLTGEQRLLVLRASFMLGLASGAVAMLPFRFAIRFGCVPVKGATVRVSDCVWAVETAARRLPWRTMCIEKGLTAQRMLRSGGLPAVLHYGARHHPETRKLEAHVWVTLDRQVVMGGDEAPNFALIASYP